MRYLCTANKVLPTGAREAKPGELEAINARVIQIKNEANEINENDTATVGEDDKTDKDAADSSEDAVKKE